jgi:predicted RNA binding protein YcfA (HicA-like mRNA interferase family)
VDIFQDFGFQVISQRGSHIRMRRLSSLGQRQTLAIPNHREVKLGTCRAIFRQALKYIPESELAPHFYTD